MADRAHLVKYETGTSESAFDKEDLRRLFWCLLGATRGGEMRARLLSALRAQPGNANQLARRLGVEYRTIQHHIAVLEKNSLVDSAGGHYGLAYFLSPLMENHIEDFNDVCRKLKFKLEQGFERESESGAEGRFLGVLIENGFPRTGVHQPARCAAPSHLWNER